MKQLFVLDPIELINPVKDSSAALIEACYRASIESWVCTPSDLQAKGAKAGVVAKAIIPEPWLTLGEPNNLSLNEFHCIWMRKDPPVDEAFLYATHLLEVAERNGVLVLNKPSSLSTLNISKYVNQKNSVCSKLDIEITTSIDLSSKGNLYGSSRTTSTFSPLTISMPMYSILSLRLFLILEFTDKDPISINLSFLLLSLLK